MILSVGEILADVFIDAQSGRSEEALGGAPFNLAVAAKREGAKVAFWGRVGADERGKRLKTEAEKYALDLVYLQNDPVRKTTVAQVTLQNGERDFTFLRENTADYHLDWDTHFLGEISPTILHLGSLMLNEPAGAAFAEKAAAYAIEKGILFSFDVNYRADLFSSPQAAFSAYEPFIRKANLLKFSEEELLIYKGKPLNKCANDFPHQTVCVTLGAKGSLLSHRGKVLYAPSNPVKPIDTTGAGDAFFGAFISLVDQTGYENLTEENLLHILSIANERGAQATQYKGAIRL